MRKHYYTKRKKKSSPLTDWELFDLHYCPQSAAKAREVLAKNRSIEKNKKD